MNLSHCRSVEDISSSQPGLVNARDQMGRTPLHMAVKLSQARLFYLAQKKPCFICCEPPASLRQAARGSQEAVEALLRHRADPTLAVYSPLRPSPIPRVPHPSNVRCHPRHTRHDAIAHHTPYGLPHMGGGEGRPNRAACRVCLRPGRAAVGGRQDAAGPGDGERPLQRHQGPAPRATLLAQSPDHARTAPVPRAYPRSGLAGPALRATLAASVTQLARVRGAQPADGGTRDGPCAGSRGP
jgi:hypothetical protein